MASSDSQGLQISLIIFVILTIILAVTTFVFFRQADQNATQAATDQANAQKDNAAARKALADLESLKTMAGFGAADTVESITTTFGEDKGKFMQGYAAQDQTYRGAMQQLFASYQTASAGKAAAEQRAMAIEADMNRNLASFKDQQKQFDDNVAKAQQDLDGERTKYNSDRDSLNTERTDLLAKVDTKDKEVNDAKTKFDQTAQDLTAKLETTRTRYDRVKGLIDDLTREQPDRPDGMIVSVNPRAGTVWINRGSADFLNRQTSFSVYGTDINKVVGSMSKARIEVTQILGDHMAEAKVVEDDLGNVMVPGDIIYSPLWDPGQAVHFAVIGRMDLNADHTDDRTLIENLIKMSGGVIDAMDTDMEDRDISVETRYVVQGENPVDDQTRSDKFKRIFDSAKEVGSELISVGELLDRMGYKDANRVVQLGRFARGKDMMPERPDGGVRTSTGTTSALHNPPQGRGTFRARRPPQPKTKSAYTPPPADGDPAASEATTPASEPAPATP